VAHAVLRRRGMNTDRDLEILQQSWAVAEPQIDHLTQRFYTRLFDAHPEVRGLFRKPIDQQAGHLGAALRFAVKHIGQPDVLGPALRAMGARHVSYGVVPEHYDVVGAVLLASLEEVCGDAWSPDAHAAWARAYGALSSLCLEGDASARTNVA
jgi:nitric oxide dioxygenase